MRKIILALFFFFVHIDGVCFAQQEILNKRTYNQNAFDIGNGKKKYVIHTAHVNYKDPKTGAFEKIDTRLELDAVDKKWKLSKASYLPKIPQYADDWFEFYNNYEGANHTIRAKPVCAHVKGEMHNNADDGNFVLYKDAFGKGIDLKVYAYWAGLKKVIVINKKPTDTTKELFFDFEMDLPRDKANKELVKSIENQVWTKTSQLEFKGKILKIGPEKKESYFRDARVWDSSELNESVDIILYVKDGRTYLRKIITPEVLQKAVYPLYTDHPTSYYEGAGDGFVQNVNASWTTVRGATTGSTADYTSTSFDVNTVKVTTNYYIRRVFLPIDTSGIDDAATIESASLNLYIISNRFFDEVTSNYIAFVQTTQASTTTLSTKDFDTCGELNSPSEGARLNESDHTTSQYYQINLNSTGLTWISKTGFSKFGMRTGLDIENVTPITSTNTVSIRSSEYSGTTTDPYLEVTVSDSGDTNYFPFNSINVGINVGVF
jgi:hypothetical protein